MRFFFFCFFIFTYGVTKVFAEDFKVCSTCRFTTIKSALAAAQNNDRIFIHHGIYKEGNISIEKQVDIIGINFPVVDGEYKTEIISVKADAVKISGLQLQNVGQSYTEDRAAIKIQKAKNCIISNNKIFDSFFGIYLAHSRDCEISGNYIEGKAEAEHNSGNAIHLWYCNNVTIRNNKSIQHRDGIYFEFVSSSCIENNYVTRNVRYGLHFMFSDNNEYISNTFEANNAGVAVMFSSYIIMNGNNFINNWGASSFGILLKEIRDSRMTRNVFQGNTIGLYAEGSNRIDVSENVFRQNGWALRVMANCEGINFSSNNFLSNSFELTTNSNTNYNNYHGNFWSKYSGYDLDKNGVGDVPHNPVDLFTYLVEQQPISIILMRSLFIDLLNLSEKVNPMLTPTNLTDEHPLMQAVKW